MFYTSKKTPFISARLSTTVLKEFLTDNVYFWTDSTTVLAWLKREEPSSRSIFIVKTPKYLQKLREDLRQRFINEYLALLVHRGTRRNEALEVGDVVLIGHDNVRRIDCPLGVVLEVYPDKEGVPRVARIRTSHGKDSLPVEKTPESSTDHVSDSPTDYAPDSPVGSTDNSEEKPPTKARLGRTIKIPRKLDL
ncbi:DUF5641 domain-containing protein [Trichonephila clavipes]|nr:DUF5641 domain-containing protein [Trichonephila clavipes]